MKIAQVAPLIESVPPKLYGGTERIVSYLTEELVRQGHQVTLFATGDSQTAANLVSSYPEALRLEGSRLEASGALHMLHLEKIFSQSDQFDIIHSHLDYLPFPLARRQKTPLVTTLHGRLDLPELLPLFTEYIDMPLVSISMAQRLPLPHANWLGNVYHGLPPNLLTFHEGPGSYLAFLGRISLEKRVDRAIQIAYQANYPLKIAAKVDPNDLSYFTEIVKPLLRTRGVQYLGEISDQDKSDFLGHATGLLFPIDWPEPFGLVVIEAMACGTPVIAYDHGSVSEIVEEGVTGFIVKDEKEAVTAVKRLPELSRRKVRERFEERFSAQRMTSDYLKLYERLTSASTMAIAQ